MSQFQQYGFFVEREDTPGSRKDADRRTDFPWLPLLGEASSRLTFSSQQGPRVVSTHGSKEDKIEAVQADLTSVTLEVIRHEFQSYIAMMTPPTADLRLNGIRVGPVSMLRTKDQLQLDHNCVLHVSVRHQPHVGPAEETEVGGECLLCRTPIVDGQTLFRCTTCGAALHSGSPDHPEHDRLECVLASSDCPRCREPLIREEGYEYVPDL